VIPPFEKLNFHQIQATLGHTVKPQLQTNQVGQVNTAKLG
jgi:hypothetical protein